MTTHNQNEVPIDALTGTEKSLSEPIKVGQILFVASVLMWRLLIIMALFLPMAVLTVESQRAAARQNGTYLGALPSEMIREFLGIKDDEVGDLTVEMKKMVEMPGQARVSKNVGKEVGTKGCVTATDAACEQVTKNSIAQH